MDRKIKKLLSFAMACVLSLGMFAGCDQGNPGETEPSTEPEESKISPEERGYYLAEDYVADPSLFVPSWADEWQPPCRNAGLRGEVQFLFHAQRPYDVHCAPW